MDLAQLPSRFVHIRSSAHNLHLCCHANWSMNANRDEANTWEIFYLKYLTVDRVTMLSCHGTYVCAESDKFTVKCDRKVAKDWETWELKEKKPGLFMFKSYHNRYLTANGSGRLVCDKREANTSDELFEIIDAVPFSMKIEEPYLSQCCKIS